MRTYDNDMLQSTKAEAAFSKLKERAFQGAFLGVSLLAMAGWVYFIGLMFLKFVFWCFD